MVRLNEKKVCAVARGVSWESMHRICNEYAENMYRTCIEKR